MKRKIALFFCLVLAANALFSCGAADPGKTTAPAGNGTGRKEETVTEETKTTPPESGETLTGAARLNGKKILFVGNSHTYYGRCVQTKSGTVRTQKERSGDHGYFYQLCKKCGAEVSVTNWTFGNHNLSDLFVECAAGRGCDGVRHLDDLKDRAFDYVVLQEGGSKLTAEEFLAGIDPVLKVFRDANPDVEILFMVHTRPYFEGYAWTGALDELRARGVTVVNWGKMICDVVQGTKEVPGAEQKYDKNSFIVCQSEKDGYHPNPLTGYLAALSVYCAITGESAVGKDYSFCGDVGIDRSFDFSAFVQKYYSYGGAGTNFPEIFGSENDMKGLQTLIDRALSGAN